MLRYALLQLPGVIVLILILIVVRQWVDLPLRFVWAFVALWVAKDVILYPFVRRFYDGARPGDMNSMVGARGIAEDRLTPSGYIRVHGELWQAKVMGGGPPIERGEGVRVRGVRNLTLLVEPDKEKSRGTTP